MSTSSWSLVAGGALFLLALAGFWIGHYLGRPLKDKSKKSED